MQPLCILSIKLYTFVSFLRRHKLYMLHINRFCVEKAGNGSEQGGVAGRRKGRSRWKAASGSASPGLTFHNRSTGKWFGLSSGESPGFISTHLGCVRSSMDIDKTTSSPMQWGAFQMYTCMCVYVLWEGTLHWKKPKELLRRKAHPEAPILKKKTVKALQLGGSHVKLT